MHGGCGDVGAALLWLLRCKSCPGWRVLSWSTLLRSGWSSRWCRLCLGAACQSWRLLEEFPLLRCLPHRAVRTWKSGLCLRPRILLVLGCCLWSKSHWIFRDACAAWFNSGYHNKHNYHNYHNNHNRHRALPVKVGNTSVRTCSLAVDSSGCAMEYEHVGATKRRRSDGCTPCLRHERMTVAMALAENLHHSRQKVEGSEHEGLRAQQTARATGARPGVLEEPEPQGGAVTAGYVPSLAVPLLAGAAGEVVDSSSLRFLTAAALRQREEEEEKFEAKYKETQRPAADAIERARVLLEQAGKRKKRKKKRKRRLPRTSSRPSRQLRRRLPCTCPCLPTSGTTSSVVSRVRRRVGLLVFLPAVCGLLASTAQRQFRIGLCFSPGLWSAGGCIYLDMSEHTRGVAFDAIVP